MKFVIFAIALGIAGFILFQIAQPVCAGGVVVETENQCAEKGLFSSGFCHKAFGVAHDVVHSGAGYTSQIECEKRWNQCIRADHMTGYVRKPKNVCVKKSDSGEPAVEVYY